MPASEYRRLLELSDYSELKDRLSRCDLAILAEEWNAFKPMEKLVLFKLMDPPRAMEFYGSVDLGEKYFLLCAYDLNSIAPVLEALPKLARELFVRLPAVYYDRMLRMMVSDQIEIHLASPNN